jgi:hypothetical protein
VKGCSARRSSIVGHRPLPTHPPPPASSAVDVLTFARFPPSFPGMPDRAVNALFSNARMLVCSFRLGKDTQIIGSSHLEWVHPHDRNMVRAAFAACLKDAPGTVRHVPRHRFQGAKPAAKSGGRFLGVRYDATLAPTEGGEEGALRTTANSCERGPSRRAMIIEDDIEWSQVRVALAQAWCHGVVSWCGSMMW